MSALSRVGPARPARKDSSGLMIRIPASNMCGKFRFWHSGFGRYLVGCVEVRSFVQEQADHIAVPDGGCIHEGIPAAL